MWTFPLVRSSLGGAPAIVEHSGLQISTATYFASQDFQLDIPNNLTFFNLSCWSSWIPMNSPKMEQTALKKMETFRHFQEWWHLHIKSSVIMVNTSHKGGNWLIVPLYPQMSPKRILLGRSRSNPDYSMVLLIIFIYIPTQSHEISILTR